MLSEKFGLQHFLEIKRGGGGGGGGVLVAQCVL